MKPRFTPDQARDLLALAHARGLRARPARQPGVTLVSSHTYPNVWYRVTPKGCPCRGYRQFGRCTHYALAAWTHRQSKAGAAVAPAA